MKSRKLLLAALAATALGGCAAYPYPYDDYAYRDNANYPDNYAYRDGYYPGYYGPPAYYVGPSVGFGITYSDRHRHHWH
jgi:hypothetical protein